MPKNIIILVEGSGNAFDDKPSNVSRVLEVLHLGEATGASPAQIAIYDQGVGTRLSSLAGAQAFADQARARCIGEAPSVVVLDAPLPSRWWPKWATRVAGLAFGSGLASNVEQIVTELRRHHHRGDNLYMFGFSRGAFTVRVVAAVLYRFGLPPTGVAVQPWLRDALDRMQRDAKVEHGGVESVPIHFLGLWDTVKSYGFIRPVRYFHLRHNPAVFHVRHAVALDEKRSWFQFTSWGGLDSDAHQRDHDHPERPRHPMPEVNPAQTVEERWFNGCHSDIGGGSFGHERKNAETTLRWILTEARAVGLGLIREGAELCAAEQTQRWPITESRLGAWWLAEFIPRWEIDNHFSPAQLRFKAWPTGRRKPLDHRRGNRGDGTCERF